ncbi:MAG TPA: alpha/beta fold hydrolase [Jiangellales bacterium]|nr:alpha/beta fold hydrolase [Jiangellales bacterium]
MTEPTTALPRHRALVTDDGVRIAARYDPPRTAGDERFGVVLAHGLTGSTQAPDLRRVSEWFGADTGVVTFDFRGHGRSGGRSTVGDLEVLDLDAAVRWARTLGHERVVTVGWSMGAAVAVRHAGLVGGVDAVVAVSGPAYWYYRGSRSAQVAHRAFETRAGRAVLRYRYRTRIDPWHWVEDRPESWPPTPEQAASLVAPTPLLVVHGDVDTWFPPEHAHRLYDAAREPKELWLLPGFGHAESGAVAHGEELVRRISTWLRSRPEVAG